MVHLQTPKHLVPESRRFRSSPLGSRCLCKWDPARFHPGLSSQLRRRHGPTCLHAKVRSHQLYHQRADRNALHRRPAPEPARRNKEHRQPHPNGRHFLRPRRPHIPQHTQRDPLQHSLLLPPRRSTRAQFRVHLPGLQSARPARQSHRQQVCREAQPQNGFQLDRRARLRLGHHRHCRFVAPEAAASRQAEFEPYDCGWTGSGGGCGEDLVSTGICERFGGRLDEAGTLRFSFLFQTVIPTETYESFGRRLGETSTIFFCQTVRLAHTCERFARRLGET
jgi:hypothetical protein